jgi:predicted phosphate transport protein (TIGR00153 family)
MKLREFIIPHDNVFFDLLTEQAEILLKGAETLYDLMENNQDVQGQVAKIKDLEHQGDAVAHQIYTRLNNTFITPLDQEDLMSLTSKLDDVLDMINGISKRFFIFEIGEPAINMKGFSKLIFMASREINLLVTNIRKINRTEIDRGCEEIDLLENQGDELLHGSLVDIFKMKDAVEIIKYKEIYEWLELALDRCEDVGYAIADIVTKNR